MLDKEIVNRFYFKRNLIGRKKYLENYIYLDTSEGFYLSKSFKNAIKEKISLIDITLKEISEEA